MLINANLCDAVPVASCNTTDCSLSVFGAFSGSDKYSVSLTTGLQLSKINNYALSGYFYNAKQQVDALLLSLS